MECTISRHLFRRQRPSCGQIECAAFAFMQPLSAAAELSTLLTSLHGPCETESSGREMIISSMWTRSRYGFDFLVLMLSAVQVAFPSGTSVETVRCTFPSSALRM